MDLALARIRDNVGQLRGPVQRSVHEALRRRIAGRVKVAHLRYCLGAALSVALVGIGVNALLLQHERHPAPLFGFAPPKRPPPLPRQPRPPPPKPVSAEHDAPPAQLSHGCSRRRGLRPPPRAPPRRPIRSPICWPGKPTAMRDLILAAQTALAKLGYPVKPDGKEGAATEQALRDFERAHGLPPATEINERLVKQLTQAARGGGH